MKARVFVRLKPEVSDPQGIAIGQALATLHYGAVKAVRAGKVFDLELDEADPERARAEIDRIAREVLSNPTIEDYKFEIEDGTCVDGTTQAECTAQGGLYQGNKTT